MDRSETIRARIAPSRQRLLAHPLYGRMSSLEDARLGLWNGILASLDEAVVARR